MTKNYVALFPGQGSQSLGMISNLQNTFPSIQKLFSQATQILGYDLWKLIQEGPEEKLNKTEFTQPALLVANVAVWECWKTKVKTLPQFMAGHSLGEYSAMVCAGAISFPDAVKIVSLRGKYMQHAVPEGTGAMAAIVGLEESDVNWICENAAQNEVVSAANFNSIGQIVIAGHTQAVIRAIELAKKNGAKIAKLLPVSVPSHCMLMKPAAEHLAAELKSITISKPTIPIVQNYDVAVHADVEAIRNALIQQLTQPVRWVETMQWFVTKNIQEFIECGPGKVLVGLNKRIDPSINTYTINEPELLEQAARQIEGVTA